jgi:ATP-dependent Clp protease ATP-binding subunit ClpA
MTTFSRYLRGILDRAGREARADRSTAIEAQHVLLAIAARPETPPGQVLASAGLDHRAVREALDREFEHSLNAAGVSRAGVELPPPSDDPGRVTQLGASVRLAMERGVAGVPRDPQPAHLLLGILQAQVGTVPRALALAGVDRAGLAVRVRQTLM